MPKPTIAHVISDLDIGGAERQLAIILPQLQKMYDNQVICITGKGSIAEQLKSAGIPVHYLNASSHKDISVVPKLARLIYQIQPDLIIGYLVFADVITRLIAARYSIPYISSQRSSHVAKPYARIPDLITSPLVTAYTVQTTHAKQQLEHLPLSTHKPKHIIPNAVVPTTRSTNYKLQITNTCTVTCVANLKPGKGHNTLLKAIQNFKFEILNLKLVLAGSGPLKSQLQTQAKQLGISQHVSFLGTVKDIPALLAQTDIFVLPTEGEGMSNALLEAMAAGLPCITTDIPANREIITHNQTGLLVPAKDANALAAAIKTLSQSPQLRQRLGQAAQQHAQKHFNPITIAKKWEELISTYAQ